MVKAALHEQPGIHAEVQRSPNLVDLLLQFVIAEFDAQLTAVVSDMRKTFGGEQFYHPKRSERDRQRIAADVLRLFNGRNASEVARRLGISRATDYRVLKQGAK